MQVSFLGPFEVDGADGPVTLGGAKERTLLALLALRANEVVSTPQLISGLWGEDPPASAVKTVHGNVARVRRALAVAGLADVLVTKEPGYFLRAEPEHIDAVRFERHARAGRLALGNGDAATAERELAAGLGLWRGEALANCRDASEHIAAEAVRLDELRWSAIEDRMDAQLALGRHSALVGELEALLVRQPLRERLWHSLMLALYRSRRQAEALRAYQRARSALVEDLGVEPSTALHDLEGAILRADPGLELVGGGAEPLPGTPPTPDSSSARLMAWATGGPVFVGRDDELATLTQLWRRACDAERQVVMIGGEPGIGKTRLAAETCVIARDEGARVLHGRCDEDLAVPYQPFVEMLRAYIEGCTDAELAGSLGRYPGELVRLVPELVTRVENLAPPLRSDPATEQYRLFEAVVEWLGAAAAQCPSVVVLDDLQWAAPPTVLLLRHVIRSGRFDRALLMGTYRQSELEATHPLAEMLADVHMSAPAPCIERIDLGGLDAPSVESFVETASGRKLGEAGRRFALTVHRETGGNPFFVGEIVHNVMQGDVTAGPSVATAPDWPTDLHIPPAARDVVVRRVARLSEDAQHVLTIASVAGAEFDVSMLEEIVDVDLDALLGALEEATAARVVDEVGSDRFAFTHAIARGALYDRLSASRRLRLHGRVADALERMHQFDRDEHLSELAFHCAEANSTKAVRYAIEAGSVALDRLAFEDAVSICTRGLAAVERSRTTIEPVAPLEECDLLLALGRAELRAGMPTGRETLLRASELARSLRDVPRQSASVLAVNRGFFSRIGRIDDALVAALEHAIDAQGPSDTRERAELLATLASELVWSPDNRRFELSDLALSTARRVGDPRTLARVLLLRCMTIQAPDTRDERSALLRELRSLAEALGDPASTFDSAFAYSGPAWESGDVEGMNEMEELATALAAELRQPRLEWQASFMRAARRLYEGDLDRAEQTADETLELGRRAGQHGEAFIFYNEQILEIRRWQARLGELLEVVGSFAGNAAVDFGYSLTRYLYDAGDVDRARQVYEEKMVPLRLPPRRDMLALTTLYNFAYLAARFGDTTRAHATYDALTPHASAFTSTTVAKPVGEHFLGMLAATLDDVPLAAEHFWRATVAHERACAPLLLAETHLEHARLLVATRAPGAELDRLLASARAIARPRGAAFILLGCDEVDIVRS
ncbi:MAG: BTAD domain-containing putative transcriptional regulator [Acidimicrobiia bacterium]